MGQMLPLSCLLAGTLKGNGCDSDHHTKEDLKTKISQVGISNFYGINAGFKPSHAV
jgi:hypothetical protein